jgi:GT2 family glycosyltransferase
VVVTGPTVSIIVVLYNSASELAGCLESIRDEVQSGWAELLLVDNASPDESLEIATALMPNSVVIRLAENLGFAGGVNVALSRASGRYLFLLNPDVAVPAGGLAELVQWMEALPQVGVLSPRINDADGNRVGVAQRFPSIGRVLLEMSRLHRLLPARVRSRVLLGAYWDGCDTTSVDWVPGTAMLARADVVKEVGPLSEKTFMYGEDMEWCWRMRRNGYLAAVGGGKPFIHQGAASAARTWGVSTYPWLVARGVFLACCEMYGRGPARAWAAVNGLALLLERYGRGRDESARSVSGAWARAYLQLALTGRLALPPEQQPLPASRT